MIFFLLWNKKIYFEGMDVFVHTMKVNVLSSVLAKRQNKEIHTGLELHE